jgi:hypothetical protein
MPLLEELLQKEIKANWPGYQSFCAWVATACCKDNVSDTSILAIEARLLRRTAKVKEEARRLWNVFQDAEAKMANMKKRQQKPSKEKVKAAVPITAGSRRVKPTRSKRPRPAAVTPQKKRKPSERESRTVSSDPSSESSSSSDSSSSSSDDSDDSDDSSDTSDSSASSIQPKKKKKHGKITRPRTSHSKTKSLIAMMMRGNRKNLKIALKARDDAIAATGSPASKMPISRQVALEAMTGHHDGQIPFVPPQIYADLEAASWTKEAIQNLQRRFCKGVKGSMYKSNITVTNKMNLTLKTGDYSCGNDCSYEGCKNGVSPFSVPPLSLAMAREDNIDHEAFEAATHRTPAESKKQIQGTKATPPKSLSNAIKHLNNYVTWLEVLVGDECVHLLAVIKLRDCLDENEDRLEPVLTDRLLLTILWKVHEDARQFFYRCEMWNRGEPLPKSHLKGMVRLLEEELTVIESITCPYDDFLGKIDKGKEKEKGKDRDKGKEGEDPKKREPQATVNPNIPALCSATVKKILALHPTMTITQFCTETGIPLKDVVIGSRGSCTTFGLLGICRSGCTFRHVVRTIPDKKQKEVNAALQKGLKILEEKKKVASA